MDELVNRKFRPSVPTFRGQRTKRERVFLFFKHLIYMLDDPGRLSVRLSGLRHTLHCDEHVRFHQGSPFLWLMVVAQYLFELRTNRSRLYMTLSSPIRLCGHHTSAFVENEEEG
ncbi:hypothetical protein FRB91_003454 [Serendipita sp. 411]|nr:hypothetical protein FRC15_007462 [Serendipita sp. 397]KAG8797845.1 hypothetical protein FRC16_008465 [Serendipita sp. 398]KAG8820030.1 hypothetical protein FRC18_011862 [Serendipita sp. 400]KAG8834055.1 hypothetical protein FRC20_007533 [Serendipita sp. 405]KAG8854497.1 hypothetical protein FRB91_003454 [Serendipita sp. 411]